VEGERLGAPEVLGHRVADLMLREDGAAEQHAAGLGEALLEAGDHVLLVGVGFERGEQVGLLAVATEHRLLRDGGDARLLSQLGANVGRLRLVAHQGDDAGRLLRAGRRLDPGLGARRARFGGDEPARGLQ
jgi:hypothetical protein